MKKIIDFKELSREELILELQKSHVAIEELNAKLEVVLQQEKEEKSIVEILIDASKEFIRCGKIWVESELDTGSVFYFTIPKDN